MSLRLQQELISLINIHPFKQHRICSWSLKQWKKPVSVKTPTQHYINLNTLETKIPDCIQVDGAGDEGPGHVEVQFLWTEWHTFKRRKPAQLSQPETAVALT